MTTLAVAGIFIVIVFFKRTRNHGGGGREGQAWFYDLKTRQLFPAPARSIPPIDAPSGSAAGVRAYVYACGESQVPGDRVIAFLEELTPDGKQEVEKYVKQAGSQAAIGSAMERVGDEVLVSSPEKEEWVPKNSPEGLSIMKLGRQKAGCAHPKLCLP
jgi:hypothetical protein